MVFPLIGLSRGFIRRRHFVCRRRQDRDKTDHPAISPLKARRAETDSGDAL
jgi:hypothetical protein